MRAIWTGSITFGLVNVPIKLYDRTAIVQFSLRQKTRLGALRSRGKVLMLQSLLRDDEVREADFDTLGTDVKVSAQELVRHEVAGEEGVDRKGGSQEVGGQEGELTRRLRLRDRNQAAQLAGAVQYALSPRELA